jgi:hypothetical protein
MDPRIFGNEVPDHHSARTTLQDQPEGGIQVEGLPSTYRSPHRGQQDIFIFSILFYNLIIAIFVGVSEPPLFNAFMKLIFYAIPPRADQKETRNKVLRAGNQPPDQRRWAAKAPQPWRFS